MIRVVPGFSFDLTRFSLGGFIPTHLSALMVFELVVSLEATHVLPFCWIFVLDVHEHLQSSQFMLVCM